MVASAALSHRSATLSHRSATLSHRSVTLSHHSAEPDAWWLSVAEAPIVICYFTSDIFLLIDSFPLYILTI